LGDFYEAFHEDAVRISKDIGLTLTARQGVPMCGIPFHTSDHYIDKLVAKGYKVAVAEQVEDPKMVKGLVKREIVRMVSPGTLINSNLLVDKKNNYFASVAQVGSLYGLGALDVSTGELRTLETEKRSELFDELQRLRPSEILVSKKFTALHPTFFSELSFGMSFVLTEEEPWRFEPEMVASEWRAQFAGPVTQLAIASAVGAMLGYLKQDLHLRLEHVTQIRAAPEASMSLDHSTLKNLGIIDSLLPILD
jgi:DNA mismatch repair protein MutS